VDTTHQRALAIVEELLDESPTMRTLEKNKVDMTDEERKQAMKGGAVWHFSSNKGKPSCAIWKSVVKGKTYYGCNTHRYAQARRTLKAAIRAFHDVVEPTA